MALAISSSSTVTISSTYFSHQRKRVRSPARRTAMPSAMVLFAGNVTRPVLFEGGLHRRQLRGLHADHLEFSAAVSFTAQATPAISPPPPTGMTTASRSLCCFEHFEAQRSLAGDHGIVIEGMDEGEAALLAAAHGFLASLVVIRARQDDFRPISRAWPTPLRAAWSAACRFAPRCRAWWRDRRRPARGCPPKRRSRRGGVLPR